ncbi:MAG TPA: PAS domain-containing protein, partial [Planctomycetota bacterium]|nr:PAS domain-containing protein [Planctomycetota bacterium]
QYVNGAALRNLGLEAESVVGRDVSLLSDALDREGLRAALRPLLAGEVDELELASAHRRADGTTYPVEAQLQRSRYGGRDSIVAMAIDVTDKRAAEQALAESEERFDRAMRGSSDGFWDWVVDREEAWFSPRFQELLGYIPGAFPARFDAWSDALHPEDRDGVLGRLRATIDSGEPFDARFRLRTAHGEYRWYRGRARSTSGGPEDDRQRLSGAIADITEQVAAERALRESEERLSMALSSAGAGVWVWDLRDDSLQWDQQMHALFDTEPASFTGHISYSLERHLAEDLPAVTEAVRLSTEEGKPFAVEYRIALRDGSYRHIASRGEVHRDAAGKPVRLVGICWDVSEAHQQRDALRRQEDLLGQTQTLARIGGWELDLRDQSLYWTSEVYRIHEVDESHVPTVESSVGFYETEAVPLLRDALRRAREDGEPFDLELPFRTARGRALWVRTLGQPQREDGEVVRITGAFQDVTDSKRTELELGRARDEAELANRTKSEFLANMSHEIRTPMTAILGFAELLLDREVEEAARRSHVDTIRRNGEHLLAIINDILDLSKIEAGRMELEFRATDPLRAVDEVLDLLRVRAEQQGIVLERRVQGDLPAAFQSDPIKLRQILLNLIGNAIKFTPEGSVVVTLRSAELDGGPGLAFDVDDTGIGIPLERRTHLFDAFAQVDSSTARSFGGTGLGLAISIRLAQMLGGSIDVRSTIGVGSRFTVTVSATPCAAPAAPHG